MQIREDLNFGLKQCFTICVFFAYEGKWGGEAATFSNAVIHYFCDWWMESPNAQPQ